MATVSGVLSADQITSLIQQASTAFQAPATALQAQEQPIATQISALGQVQGALSGLQSSLAQLANVQSLTQRVATSSASGIVQARVTNAASVGTYTLAGIQLAHAETLQSSGFASTSASFGSGTLTIQVGSGSAVTVNVPSGQDTLAGIAAAINQSGSGVDAAVIFDGTSYHLTLSGEATGAANAFTVSGSGALAALSYRPGAQNLTLSQAATNASFTLNGIAITSGSNQIAGAVQGLTFSLAASGSATVQVTQSVSALSQAAQGVVTALNQALGTINQYASYSPTSGGGPLLGDVGLQVLRTNLLSAISSPVTTGLPQGTPFSSLASIGFSVTSGGTVTLDAGKLQAAAQSNYAAVAALLGQAGVASNSNVTVTGTGAAQPGSYALNITTNTASLIEGTVAGEPVTGSGGLLTVGSGAASGLTLQISGGVTGNLGSVSVSEGLYGQMSAILSAALDSTNGSVTNEITNLNATITSMNQRIASLQAEAQQQVLALTNQYSVAQATISQLTTVSSFLTSYFNATSGSGG